MGLAIGIIALLIGLFILWKMIKPYTIKYDSTLFLTGGLGSGKTLTAVKIATNLLRRKRFTWYVQNKIILKIKNHFTKIKNRRRLRKKQPLQPYELEEPKPQIYSNLPIRFKQHFWTSKKDREWSVKLHLENLELLEEISQQSVVLIDELPQLVNQFNWDNEEVQQNINEFITFFRHYYGGHLICTAQSIDDVVCQIRRKGNMAIWCYNFHKHLFGLFYTIEMCDMILSDQVTSTSSSFVEDNTRKYYSLFPPKGTYDTRCYSERVNNILETTPKKLDRWNSLKTNKIIRLEEYNSPLDNETTKQQKQAMKNKIVSREKRKEENKNEERKARPQSNQKN